MYRVASSAFHPSCVQLYLRASRAPVPAPHLHHRRDAFKAVVENRSAAAGDPMPRVALEPRLAAYVVSGAVDESLEICSMWQARAPSPSPIARNACPKLALFVIQCCIFKHSAQKRSQESYYLPARLMPQWLSLAELFVRVHSDMETVVGTLQLWLHRVRSCLEKHIPRVLHYGPSDLKHTRLRNSRRIKSERNNANRNAFNSGVRRAYHVARPLLCRRLLYATGRDPRRRAGKGAVRPQGARRAGGSKSSIELASTGRL